MAIIPFVGPLLCTDAARGYDRECLDLRTDQMWLTYIYMGRLPVGRHGRKYYGQYSASLIAFYSIAHCCLSHRRRGAFFIDRSIGPPPPSLRAQPNRVCDWLVPA
ncbi:uncharacterized protein BO80DRAFT_106858 [Aspergillus ibericus CBS 121593]|uniref:Uncharacterized protein n=1 Tax=Aspergillus ibericus CBS 121593 TaxID=1448316 RepID=A0A395GXT3_9EURO|nr:hypothetical protein BO80DRAFT_106858 [Aspergillus ibericus CBS 121593]RAL00367.1 hypothetical protein BO80DRAFT_106858 [Aspergillus ibericus CBS 121593]